MDQSEKNCVLSSFWGRVFYKTDSNSVQISMIRYFMTDKLEITLSGSKGPWPSRGKLLESAWKNWEKRKKILYVISDVPIDIGTNHVTSGICWLSTCQALILLLFLISGLFLPLVLGFHIWIHIFTVSRFLFTTMALESMAMSDVTGLVP
jgi:hypothetical protein